MGTDGAAGAGGTRGAPGSLEVAGRRVGEVLDGTDLPRAWSPRPFVHPVRTLGGVVLTDRGPDDHAWHSGLGIALPDVDGVNCWGGPTYVPGAGYRWQDDHGVATVESGFGSVASGSGSVASGSGSVASGSGSVASGSGSVASGSVASASGSVASASVECGASDRSRLRVGIVWRGPGGDPLLHEDRTLAWGPALEGWQVTWTSSFRAAGGRRVVLGSPGSHGRTGAGYGGWFLRFARCTDVVVRTPDGSGEDQVHGSITPWVSWTGSFDGGRAHVLVEALDHRDPWFVRVAEYPAVGSALAWDFPTVVAPDEPLVRSFRVTVSDA
ncbi:DUF6807 family protein [Curtobacterium sp. TXMA1]|uniref:DUF6807 family protein n=1 Tax=Curtobacterium sp. TXMA1 TaxID=2876939 RepID=UPI001CCF83FC|nr:DUF6807 family protein [Curtobacterium sp. TXMA1]UBQ03655.1 PmoA family protein [Curtobacterium sp. TXMA1]